MSKRYLPYDEELSVDKNIIKMIAWEIEKTCPPDLLVQKNPFIYLMAVKNMIFTGKLGLSMRFFDNQRQAIPLVTALTMRELDMLLAQDATFNSQRVSAEEFAMYLVDTLLPSSAFALYLKRDD